MPPSSRAPSYAAVLRTPHACRTFAAALLGRLSYGMLSLAGVLAVKDATDSYATAGTVMALLWLTSVLLSPTRAALIDRHGVRRALPPMATAFATLLAVLALATSRGGASALLLGSVAVLAGATTPPLGPVMRTLWSQLVPERGLLRRAYSLDAVAEELLLVVGPLLVGLLTRVTVPSVGLAVSAALVLTGSLALAASPPARRPKGPAAPPATPSDVPPPRAGASARRRPPLRGGPGLRQAIVVSAGVGTCLGALDLLVIAFADAHHRPGTVPWTLAALSAGSALGGLVHGAVPWRSSHGPRLSLLAVTLGLVLATTGLAPHPYALIAWAGVGGLFLAPALTTAYLLADESVNPAARTQAGAWVNTAFNAGSAGATAAAGWLVGRLPLSLCFALAAVPTVLSAAAFLGPARDAARAAPSRADLSPATVSGGAPGRMERNDGEGAPGWLPGPRQAFRGRSRCKPREGTRGGRPSHGSATPPRTRFPRSACAAPLRSAGRRGPTRTPSRRRLP